MSTHIKSSTIRRLTRLAKSLYPTMNRVPRPLPRPGDTSFWAPQSADTKALQARQEAFEKKNTFRLDKETIRFFAVPFSNEGSRSSR